MRLLGVEMRCMDALLSVYNQTRVKVRISYQMREVGNKSVCCKVKNRQR